MKHNELIKNSIEIIEEKLFEKISVTELAENVFFSKNHFQRLFQAIVGDSVMEYVKKRRLVLAGKELCETNSTVLNIALKYGYNSHEGFTRAFKSHFGISPNEFRKAANYFDYKPMEVTKMLNDNVILKRASDNISDIVKMLEGFANGASELKIFINHIIALNLNRAMAFKVLSNELNNLEVRVRSVCQAIGEFNNKDNKVFEVYNMTFKIIKVMDDVAFQTNLLTFLSDIEAARCGEPREQFEEITEKFRQLCSNLVCEKVKMADIISDLIKLISTDIKNEAFAKCDNICEHIKNLSLKGNAIYDDAKAATEKFSYNKALMFIVSEIKTQSNSLANIYDNCLNLINNAKDNRTNAQPFGVYLVESQSKLEDMAFFSNIAAFNASIEAARAGDNEVFNNISKRLFGFAGEYHGTIKNCYALWEEAKQMLSILDNGGDKSQKSIVHTFVRDISFQGRILCYQFGLECERWQNTDFLNLFAEFTETTKYIENLLGSFNKLEVPQIKLQISEYAASLKTAVGNLELQLAKTDFHGDAIRRVYGEYKNFTDKVDNVLGEI